MTAQEVWERAFFSDYKDVPGDNAAEAADVAMAEWKLRWDDGRDELPATFAERTICSCVACPYRRFDALDDEPIAWCSNIPGRCRGLTTNEPESKPPPEWCPLRDNPVLLRVAL